MKKYYLKTQVDYSTKKVVLDDDGDEEEIVTKHTIVKHSVLFDDRNECVKYGNKLISNNKFLMSSGRLFTDRFEQKWGFKTWTWLNNEVTIHFSILTLDITEPNDLDSFLKQFDTETFPVN